MANPECPHCGNALANGVASCGTCGKEVKGDEVATPSQGKGLGRKKIYAMIAVLLAVLGGAALLIFMGLLPNPLKGGGSLAATVNGEKISAAEVEQRFDLYTKRLGKSGQPDLAHEGKAAAAKMRRQILDAMIQEKILMIEAAREKIIVPPQEVTDKITAVKKNLNLSDKDFETFLKNNGMTTADFEKRVARDLLVSNLIAKGMQEKGLTKEALIGELNKRAKIEVFAK